LKEREISLIFPLDQLSQEGLMKRKRRVICEDFPEGSIPRDELKRAFRELREKRLARERRARLAAPNASSAKRGPARALATAAAAESPGDREHA